ncbi:MAG: hypothetical protein AABZ02_01815 [Bacteroidota bacterium]
MSAKNIILATVLGGIAFFLWGAISHMLLPFSNSALLKFQDQDAITQAIIANAPSSGVYFLPNMTERTSGMTQEEFDAANKRAEDQMMNGPFMLASVRLGPMGSYPLYFAFQLITDMLAALFIGIVLARVQIPYWNRVLLSLCVGLAGFVAFSLPQWNWYAFSNAFTFAELVDAVAGFFLAGLVIARFVPGKEETPKPSAQA